MTSGRSGFAAWTWSRNVLRSAVVEGGQVRPVVDHGAVPAEVVVHAEHVEVLVGRAWSSGSPDPRLAVEPDEVRVVHLADRVRGVAHVAHEAGAVGAQRGLLRGRLDGERPGEDRRVVQVVLAPSAWPPAGPATRTPGALPEAVGDLVDGRVDPVHDPGAVERLEEGGMQGYCERVTVAPRFFRRFSSRSRVRCDSAPPSTRSSSMHARAAQVEPLAVQEDHPAGPRRRSSSRRT